MAEKIEAPFIPQILAQNLTRLRKRAGYKQTEFATLCGMSKQRLWYYEHAYKGRLLPAEVAIDVSIILERVGLGLEVIATASLLPETAVITLPPPILPAPSDDKILEVLQDVRALLLEIRDAGRQKALEGRSPRIDRKTDEDDRG
jgi:transcriptional regulator with XRE-family HTH domain